LDARAVVVSVVIPAFNEEGMIETTILAAREALDRAGLPHEVIVVDHGSTDGTAAVSRASEALVLSAEDAATISTLRNRGVQLARGEFLVFLDADTSLTLDWSRNIQRTLESLRVDPLQLCGSVREVPDGASVIGGYWYHGLSADDSPTHLGGGHIITTPKAVERIGGFDESLETGEDYEFCVRARARGVPVRGDRRLRAIHRGAPTTVAGFVRREVWHGRGDLGSLRLLFRSPVALVSIVFVALHLGALWGWSDSLPVFVGAIGSIVLLCVLASMVKYRGQRAKVILANTLIFYLYFVGRALSVCSVVLRPQPKRRERG
jgi:GT2 family glycosyltransferase